MERKLTADTIVGLFVLAGLIAMLAVTFIIRQDYFRSTMTISATFESVSGLEIGAPVLVNGIGGGRVARIEFKEGVEPTYSDQKLVYDAEMSGEIERPVVVRLIVMRNIPLYSNARVKLAQQGFIGDRRVEIDPGEPGPGISQVQEGDVLAGAPIFDMAKVLAEARGVIEEVQGAVRGIREIVTDDETILSVRDTIANVNSTVQKVNDYLVANETDVRATVEETRALVSNARAISDEATGYFGEDGEVEQLLAEVNTALSELRAESRALLERGNVTAEKVNTSIDAFDDRSERLAVAAVDFMDTTKANQAKVLADLEQTQEHLDAILLRLRQGEGTVGRLLVDAQPFEDMKASIQALHNFFVGGEARFYDESLKYIPPAESEAQEPETP